MELNEIEKLRIVGIIFYALRSRKKIKQSVGLGRVPDLMKLMGDYKRI